MEDKGAPVDVLWFRLPKPSYGTERPVGIIDEGRLLVMIDRGDYGQCVFNVTVDLSAIGDRRDGWGAYVQGVGHCRRTRGSWLAWCDRL